MGRKLLALTTAFLLGTGIAKAEVVVKQDTYYTLDGIKVKEVSIPDQTVLSFKGKGGFSPETQGCSVMGQLYSQLGLSIDLNAVKNVIQNWKSIALPATLYALALQFPYVKDVLVSTQYISNALAKLGTTNCQSAFSFINKVNGVSPEAVAECYSRVFGAGGVCTTSDDPDQCFLEHCGVHRSWYELVSGKTFSELAKDSKALSKLNQVLSMIDPKTVMSCALGLSDIPDDMDKAEFDANAVKVAEELGISEPTAKVLLTVVATLPTAQFTSQGLGLRVAKIDGQTLNLLYSLNLIRDDLKKDIADLVDSLSTAMTPDEVEKAIEPFVQKYNLDLTNAENIFRIYAFVKEKLNEECTVNGETVEGEPNCTYRIIAFQKAKQDLANVLLAKYVLSLKTQLDRYIDRTKAYLLQAGDKGIAECSKLQGKEIDLSPKAVDKLLKQLTLTKESVDEQLNDFLVNQLGVTPETVDTLTVELMKDLAQAVDGRVHAEGEVITFSVEGK